MSDAFRADTVIVGAGPAGMAAAVAVLEQAGSVLVLDETGEPGGQIWRRHPSKMARFLRKQLWSRRAVYWPLSQVVGRTQPGALLVEQPRSSEVVQFETLILAPGGRERFLPFPGWTLPGVAGAGGLELLARNGLPVRGKRVVVAGTGPLLLAAAAELATLGARIVALVEQASGFQLARLAMTAATSQPQKLVQGAHLRWLLRRVPHKRGWWPVRALGSDRVEAVEITNGHQHEALECDYLACGFHLIPNVELPALLGCRVQDGRTVVDEWQRTSESAIYAVGETTGVAGAELALLEGRIAGLDSQGAQSRARRLFRSRRRVRRFSEAMERAFRLRSELRRMPNSETIICRCEDVVWKQLKDHSNWRQAKLQTRCGMGPCQGRICGPACEFLLGWDRPGVRPPLLPVRLGTLAESESKTT